MGVTVRPSTITSGLEHTPTAATSQQAGKFRCLPHQGEGKVTEPTLARLANRRERANRTPMDFDDQLRRYFGTADLAAIHPEAHAAGTERMRVDFGLETNPGRRFALWALMHMLGVAPDLDVAFKDEGERNTARDFMDMVDRAGKD